MNNSNFKKIIDFEMKRKNNQNRPKLFIIKLMGEFLSLMLLFTVLSRAATNAATPRVSIVCAQKKTIDRTISITGSVVQEGEQAINCLSGIKIKSIDVSIGQEVFSGDMVFTLDVNDLKEQKDILEGQIKKIELQIADNANLESSQDNKDTQAAKKANEDYNRTVSDGNTVLTKLYNVVVEAERKLKDYREKGMNNKTSENMVEKDLRKTCKEKKELLENYLNQITEKENKRDKEIEDEKILKESVLNRPLITEEMKEIESRIQAEYKDVLTELENNASVTKNDIETSQAALSEYLESQDEANQNSYEEQEQVLIDAYNAAVSAYDDAVRDNNGSIDTAARAVQEASITEPKTSENERLQIDIEEQKILLDKMSTLLDQAGIIYSPADGIVTKVNIEIGSDTSENAAVVLADIKQGVKFIGQATATDMEYIQRKDEVVIKTTINQEIGNIVVDMIERSEETPELTNITVLLPPDSLDIGTVAYMEINKKSEPYSCCIPANAIRMDGAQKYVLVLTEINTILGKEFRADRVDVHVLDKNELYAAIEQGSIANNQSVIVETTKPIAAGERVVVEDENL